MSFLAYFMNQFKASVPKDLSQEEVTECYSTIDQLEHKKPVEDSSLSELAHTLGLDKQDIVDFYNLRWCENCEQYVYVDYYSGKHDCCDECKGDNHDL